MQSIHALLSNLNDTYKLPSANERRKSLILEMEQLEGKTIHCFTCPGTCCTSQANSMQITPIEAIEILQSLEIDQMTKEQKQVFIKRMEDTISAYRLDIEIYTGKKGATALRKNYTCPFFNNGKLGCGLSRSFKPYGCLGFNPKTSEDNGKFCSSNTQILSQRDNLFEFCEQEVNEHLKKSLKLSWSKKSIPQALLDVMSALDDTNT